MSATITIDLTFLPVACSLVTLTRPVIDRDQYKSKDMAAALYLMSVPKYFRCRWTLGAYNCNEPFLRPFGCLLGRIARHSVLQLYSLKDFL